MGSPGAEAQPTLVGRTVGGYTVLEPIGSGGMGEVYRAVDGRLNRTVALKALKNSLAADPVSKRRFLRETRLACQVTHPYIATVFDVVEETGSLFLVMEFIEGRRLDAVLREERPDLHQVTVYALEIVEALRAIHRAGVVHRDLKPGNVMVTPDGHVKVMDFGVARPVRLVGSTGEEASSMISTVSAGIHGTLQYMSPEQLRGAELDQRSDLFSFGVMLYEGIAGTHPFVRDSNIATASAILNEAPGKGTESRSLTESGPMRQIVTRLLEKDPDLRYPDAQALLEDLRTVSRNLALPQRIPRQTAVMPTRVVAAVGIALAAVVAVGVLALSLRRFHDQGGSGSAQPRPGIAVLAFEDLTKDAESDVRGRMVADLLSASLGETGRVRPVGADRLRDVVFDLSSGAPRKEELSTIAHALPVRWIVTGSIYREGETYNASVEVYQSEIADPVASFRVAAGGTAGIVDLTLIQLGRVLFPEAGGTRETVEASRLSSPSEKARILETRAREAVREYRLTDAISLLENALKEDPRFISAQALLARTLDQAGYGRRALEAAEKAGRLIEPPAASPSEKLSIEVRASDAQIRDDLKREIELRRSLAELCPDDPSVLASLGTALFRDTKHEEALGWVDRALALDPRDPGLHLRKGSVLLALRRHDAALAAIGDAEKLYSEMKSGAGEGRVLEERGHVLRDRGDLQGANRCYEQAAANFRMARLSYDAARAESNIADTELLRGNLAAAGSRYREALAVARSIGGFRLVVADLSSLGGKLYQHGEFEEAERTLREALAEARRLQNDDLMLEPLVDLASLLNYSGRPGEGRGLLEEALRITRSRKMRVEESSALLLLADALYQEGNLAESARSYRDVIQMEEAPGGSTTNLIWALDGLSLILPPLASFEEATQDADRAVQLARESDQRIPLVYTLVYRAGLRRELAMWTEAEEDLEAAEKLARSEKGGRLADVVPRIALERGIIASMRGDLRQASKLIDMARKEGEKSKAEGIELAALIRSSDIALSAKRAEDAARLARLAVAHPRARAVERLAARVALARALARSGETAEAAVQALQALEEGERTGYRLAAAGAAAVFVACPPSKEHGSVDLVRARGRDALKAYLEGVPGDRREAVRSRRDILWILENLGDSQRGGSL